MKRWLSGARGSALLVFLWFLGWGVGFGGLAESFVDPDGKLVDIWPAAMAFLGLAGGCLTALLLRITEGRRTLDEVSVPRFTSFGLVAGLVLGVAGVAVGLSNDIAIDAPERVPLAPALMIGIGALLGAVAGFGSAVFFQLVGGKELPAAARPQP